MRKLDRYPVQGPNSLWQLYKTISFWKVVKNFIVLQICRYTPFLSWKLWMYRKLLKMQIGDCTAVALMVMMDVLYPEKIYIGDNSIIGYQTTILTHEYLIDEYRLGDVTIGSNVMIGANTTILPGVKIGDHAVVAAGSVVHKDVAPFSMVGGNPLTVIKENKLSNIEFLTKEKAK